MMSYLSLKPDIKKTLSLKKKVNIINENKNTKKLKNTIL